MLLTRARTRASARGHRLPAGWQAGRLDRCFSSPSGQMLHHHSTKARLVSFHVTQPQARPQHHDVGYD